MERQDRKRRRCGQRLRRRLRLRQELHKTKTPRQKDKESIFWRSFLSCFGLVVCRPSFFTFLIRHISFLTLRPTCFFWFFLPLVFSYAPPAHLVLVLSCLLFLPPPYPPCSPLNPSSIISNLFLIPLFQMLARTSCWDKCFVPDRRSQLLFLPFLVLQVYYN